jgi:beta-glucosidase
MFVRLKLIALAIIATGVSSLSAQTDRFVQPDPRAVALVQQMTLEEKISLLSGASMMTTHPLTRLKIPMFRMADGPVGAHVPPPSTAIGGGIGLAASWDPELSEATGRQIGRDARSRGVNFLLGPGVNIYRTPLNGRNFEYFGEDPFLASRIAVGYVNGVQSMNVSATVKHFLGNNSEYARYTSNSIIDEHTLHEIYMPVFEAAVKEAHVGAVMSSYNKTNGIYMSQNRPIVSGVLKGAWKFPGVYMSDWTATHDGISALNNGLDLEMPFGTYMNSATLGPAIKAGVVKESTIDEHVERILSLAYRMDWMKDQQLDYGISRFDQQGVKVALRNAEEGAVLLKNDGTLPLSPKVKTIAVLGQDAYPAVPSAGGSGYVTSFHAVSLLQGVSAAFPNATVTYARSVQNVNMLALNTPFCADEACDRRGVKVEVFRGNALEGQPLSTRIETSMTEGKTVNSDPETQPDYSTITEKELAAMTPPPAEATSERWAGWFNARTEGDYIAFAQTAANQRMTIDGRIEIDNKGLAHAELNQVDVHLTKGMHQVVVDIYSTPKFFGNVLRAGLGAKSTVVDPYALELVKRADVVVVGAGYTSDNETEGGDRMFDLPVGQNELIEAAAALNKHVIVAIISGGSVNVTPWIDRVAGLFELWYPGQEGGTAFGELLTGAKSPSGRLPISWERQLSDNPSIANYWFNDAKTEDIDYKEGVFVGYRGYEKNHIEPLFPFGFGLSYTTFDLSHLKVEPEAVGGNYTVTVEVKNTGKRSGADIVELYVTDPHATVDNAPKELKAFGRVELEPGEAKTVTLKLTPRSFTHFDVASRMWKASSGERDIEVGHSEKDLLLRTSVQLQQLSAAE